MQTFQESVRSGVDQSDDNVYISCQKRLFEATGTSILKSCSQFVVTLAMLLRLINCRFILTVIPREASTAVSPNVICHCYLL